MERTAFDKTNEPGKVENCVDPTGNVIPSSETSLQTFCVDKSAQVSSKLKLQLFPVDETTRRALEKVMYKPIRDSKGIPGAKSLVVCLNGYQREDRDDIMTIVSLMGAKFSNPLVANKVTHLICYKFEGLGHMRIQECSIIYFQPIMTPKYKCSSMLVWC
ncbi:uncharacterized protein LOC141693409 isoform X2 [Apium graveolens]|uniref:uncharacterized protein LOC141693409 isoform X2 n=1 Tax=Apium graveolens TaxID=4045 RepID=UPI003D7B3546